MERSERTPSPLTGKIEWKGSALLGPVPAVMVSCGPVDAPDIITVSWTGICCTRPPMTYISVRPERHSHHLLREGGCFVINLVPAAMAGICDWCGTYTGAKVDKFARMGLSAVPSPTVDTVMIAECPVSVSCRVRQVLPLGSHDLFLAEIVGISVAPELLDETGKLHMERARLLCAMHGAYYAPDRLLATLGCSTKVSAESLRYRPDAAEDIPAGQEKTHKAARTPQMRKKQKNAPAAAADKGKKAADTEKPSSDGRDRKNVPAEKPGKGPDAGENNAEAIGRQTAAKANGTKNSAPARPGRKADFRRRRPVTPQRGAGAEKGKPDAGKDKRGK